MPILTNISRSARSINVLAGKIVVLQGILFFENLETITCIKKSLSGWLPSPRTKKKVQHLHFFKHNYLLVCSFWDENWHEAVFLHGACPNLLWIWIFPKYFLSRKTCATITVFTISIPIYAHFWVKFGI